MKRLTKSAAKAAAERNTLSTDLAEGEISKGDNSKMRILDAAAYVLSRRGYAGTRLEDIAKQAKLKISTLYYHFESREELVLEVLLTGSQRVKRHTEEAVAMLPLDASSMDRLCAAVEAHLRYILEISHYSEATIRNTGQLPDRLRRAVMEEQLKYGQFWQALVDGAAGTGVCASANERRALRLLIIGALNWTIEWWKPGRISIDEVVTAALTMTRRTLNASR
ncbi:TetR/AcrR family transcriptional regulator [Bradyrhizobium sp. 1]|uniref:TetR/AcrR family transcriptional regulator n=1 Tax=Bradyrhizobium sp. 1 TaxID=241591 RepID=UPI001FF915E2|nr:TetR/AcrR family transcriptional regulator [Bradyrhizobium sp. 1]MCK1395749.1 TetR family transcriptional regulator [Bradyrhizobium sp. 1]